MDPNDVSKIIEHLQMIQCYAGWLIFICILGILMILGDLSTISAKMK